MKKVRKSWPVVATGALLETQMTVKGVRQWKRMDCPLTTHEDTCGEWCAFYDTEITGVPAQEIVTCQGKPISILVASEGGVETLKTAEQEREAILAYLRSPAHQYYNGDDFATRIERGWHWCNRSEEGKE
jgi:hypothetical protein